MSYRLNRSDGELLIDLTDGIIDTSTTDITLIGKNYKGFGEFLNENFIKLLENFASTSNPTNPLTGQLWYDKQDQKLKVFDGTSFKSASGTIVNSSQPTNLTAGDIWIDNENNRLYLFDGSELTLVGPTYDAGQGKTGFETASQLDTTDTLYVILKLFIGGQLYGIFSPATFTIPLNFSIPGLSVNPDDTNFPKRQKLYKGFNIAKSDDESGTSGFWWNGTAVKATALIDTAGVTRSADNFLPSNSNGVTTGSIRIKNSAGLSIGVGDTEYGIIKIVGSTTVLETQQSNADLSLRVRQGSSFVNAFYADASAGKVGIFTTSPAYTLDVAGDLNVRGSLLVQGDSTYVTSTTLRIEDKNIELAIGDDSTEPNDATVDDGGIILRSENGSKDFTWKNNVKAWTSNQNLQLLSSQNTANPAFMINGDIVLTSDSLGSNILYALGLTRLGSLTELNVDDLTFDSNVVSSNTGVSFNLNGNNISIIGNGTRITGVADPVNNQDAATKDYVDTEIRSITTITSIDITGLVDPDPVDTNDGPKNSIIAILEQLKPANTVEANSIAKVFTISYSNSTVSGISVTIATDNSGVLKKTYVDVKDSNPADPNGTESVVSDISSTNTASGFVALTPTRYVYTFSSDSVNWGFQSRIAV